MKKNTSRKQVWIPKKESPNSTDEKKVDFLTALPFELACYILQYFSERELLKLFLVSKSYKNLSDQIFYYLFNDRKWKLVQISTYPRYTFCIFAI